MGKTASRPRFHSLLQNRDRLSRLSQANVTGRQGFLAPGIVGILLERFAMADVLGMQVVSPVMLHQHRPLIGMDGRHLQIHVGHLVVGVGAVHDPTRRMIAIANIVVGIVVNECRDSGASLAASGPAAGSGNNRASFRRNDRSKSAAHAYHPAARPPRAIPGTANGRAGKSYARPRRWARCILIRHNVMLCAGRNVDIAAADPQHRGMLRRRFLGEVDADAKLHDLGLARRLHVRVQHETCLGIEPPGDSRRARAGDHAGCPDDELAVRILAPGHAGVAGLIVLGVAADRLVGAIDAQPGVVRHPRVVRPQLDRLNPSRRHPDGRARRNCETRRDPGSRACRPGLSSTKSGGPVCQPSANDGVAGISASSPRGVPASTHSWSVRSSRSLSRLAPTKSPCPFGGQPGRHEPLSASRRRFAAPDGGHHRRSAG